MEDYEAILDPQKRSTSLLDLLAAGEPGEGDEELCEMSFLQTDRTLPLTALRERQVDWQVFYRCSSI